MENAKYYSTAVNDFRRARQKADLELILGRLTGRDADLLSFEEVRKKLRITQAGNRQLKDIPLDAIIGSVGRYSDFTRSFLPKQDSDRERWARVMAATADLIGLAPIEVYQIGDVYFVEDGNHRVSVARLLGAKTIQAYVTELKTKVSLTPDIQPDDLITRAEYAEFLEYTKLDTLRPEADLSLTVPGQYKVLKEHIDVHRYFMGIDFGREISLEEAAVHWYDHIYSPVLEVIRERGILRDFPNRTEADLYLWISEHRAALQHVLGMPIGLEEAALDLAKRHSNRITRFFSRLGEKILDIIIPDELEPGPKPGLWRKEHLEARHDQRLFADILVPVSGLAGEWNAFEKAIEVAKREGAQLHGLFVVSEEDEKFGDQAITTKTYFEEQCKQAGVEGNLTVINGTIHRQICDRARWVDLIALNLAHPPSADPIARLSSGFRTIIRRCSRPLLAVPEGASDRIENALLAYGGSPKSEEALFIATHLASKWGLSLIVLTIFEENEAQNPSPQQHAMDYLAKHGIGATFLTASGSVEDHILLTAEERQVDLIIMGGYEANPLVEVVIGSSVDGVLRATKWPVLICR